MVGNNGSTNTVAPGGKLKGREFLEEYKWLLSNGVHPLLACDQLRVKPINVERRLWRYGENGLASQLSRCITYVDTEPPSL